MRYPYIFLLPIFISGCATQAESTCPAGCVARVESSSSNGVVIKSGKVPPDLKIIRGLADAECAKYKRIVLVGKGHMRSSATKSRNRPDLNATLFRFQCIDQPLKVEVKEDAGPPLEWPVLLPKNDQ